MLARLPYPAGGLAGAVLRVGGAHDYPQSGPHGSRLVLGGDHHDEAQGRHGVVADQPFGGGAVARLADLEEFCCSHMGSE